MRKYTLLLAAAALLWPNNDGFAAKSRAHTEPFAYDSQRRLHTDGHAAPAPAPKCDIGVWLPLAAESTAAGWHLTEAKDEAKAALVDFFNSNDPDKHYQPEHVWISIMSGEPIRIAFVSAGCMTSWAMLEPHAFFEIVAPDHLPSTPQNGDGGSLGHKGRGQTDL